MQSPVENLQPDVPYRVRGWIGPLITRVAGTLGQPEYRLRDTEYVGTIQQPLDEFTETLQTHGFEWDPLAWYHQPSVGSEPNGSWTYQRTPFADRQIHVILIAHSPEYIDVFAHEEFNWQRHPIKHFRQIGIERKAGRTEMRRFLDRLGVEVDVNTRRRRRFTNSVKDLREYLREIIR